MNTIWKWNLQFHSDLSTTCVLDMPQYAQVLTLQRQGLDLCLWAHVDTTAPLCKRKFTIYGTGTPMLEDPGWYVGTFQLHEGLLVYHVFEQEVV